MLLNKIDKIAIETRGKETIVAAPGEQLEWLCHQLAIWPVRVDQNFTTNLSFLMLSAARTIAHQAKTIEDLTKS